MANIIRTKLNLFLGIVKKKLFHLLQPDSLGNTQVRLTRKQMHQAQSPESVEIDLTECEGQAIMVRNRKDGG